MNRVRRESRKVVVIGAGFSGLSAAAHLARSGFEVHLLEKHDQPGGRARVWEQDGFRFDMGPSWYWMPDLFEHFFAQFGKRVSDYYELERLDPSYRVYFEDGEALDVPASLEDRRSLFESIEPGSGEAFDHLIEQTRYIYETATRDYLMRPALKFTEFVDWRIVSSLFRMKMTTSMHAYAKMLFQNPKLITLTEWPVLFLGATANKTPAMYSLMTYADMALGTWYPKGGMHQIIQGMVSLAKSLGVRFHYNQDVEEIVVENGQATGVRTQQGLFESEFVLAAADYHHVEMQLLAPEYQQHSQRYWDSRVMSPSSLLYYLGLDCKIPELEHHNLFFDRGMDKHLEQVYTKPAWPEEPLFYACVSSKTDETVAPPGSETMFLLIPLAPGLEDSEEERDACFQKVMQRLEHYTGRHLRDHIQVKRSYAMMDFVQDYHAFKGNAYGMANTLRQTGPLKPKLRSNKVRNLYYAGQLTVPGPGMPPSLISGQLASEVLLADAKVKS